VSTLLHKSELGVCAERVHLAILGK